MNPHFYQPQTRREMLRHCCAGFGMVALGGLLPTLANSSALSPIVSSGKNPLAPRASHFPARAKRIIFLFMHGGPSHIDTFDYKPLLVRDHGQPLPYAKPRIQFAQTGHLRKSPWDFKAYGQCGAMVSDLFPRVGACMDDICLLKAVHGTNEAHGGALLKLNTGSDSFTRPSMGSWITYGLGTENENLPGFINICPTLGHGGVANYSSAFLPAVYQGTALAHSGVPASRANINYIAHPDSTPAWQRAQLDFLEKINRDHWRQSGPDSALEARIESFELAFRMQTEAPELLDLSGESAETKKRYGLNQKQTENFGRQCLLARRFAEKGVRFIQINHSYKWDQHEDLTRDHARNAAEVDQPIAALLMDLKTRGLLEDTLVLWGGEFGRTPTLQGRDGRDHNPHAFTMWLAGGGVKGGFSYGVTDDYGFYTVDQPVHIHDLHATLLALLGLDHERLTYRYAGRDFRLTDVEGRVVSEIFA
jgi:hypothetical protein